MSMDVFAQIPAESSLVDDQLKEQLIQIFAKLERDITLVCVLDVNDGTCREMASFLKAVAQCSERIVLKFLERGQDLQLDALLNTELLPATGLFLGDDYQRVAFHGVPGGKEINPFVRAICNVAGPIQPVEEKLQRKLSKLKKQNQIKVCVSLSCHHCPAVVAAGQLLALLSPYVTCEMIDARLYPELLEQYKITRVPAVIVNDSAVYMGEKNLEELLYLLK